MSEILKSTLLDFEKSFFYVNFMISSSGDKFITVEQTFAANYKKQKIKIKATDLSQMIATLQMYEKEMSDPDSNICKNYLPKEKQQLVIKRYFIGIPVHDLALQFDCPVQTIIAILKSNDIQIEDQKALKRKQRIEMSKRKY